jgi:hypothetical protein
MRTSFVVTSLFILLSLLAVVAHADDQPWISLFDGKALSGWEVKGGSAKVINGRLALAGGVRLDCTERCLADFTLTMDILSEAGAAGMITVQNNSEIVAPLDAIRVPINNSRRWSTIARTGSIVPVAVQFKSVAKDGEWFNLRISASGSRARVWVNGKCVSEALGWRDGYLSVTTDKGPATVFLKDMQLQTPPRDPSRFTAPTGEDSVDRQWARLRSLGFPLIDYHVHLKGDLTLEKALAHSREARVFYGIAANCGVNFPITNDGGIAEYLKKMDGQPCFVGMQAEGREWPTLFSKEAIARFDYIFTDAMTIVDHRGKRARLWMPDEVDIPDKQAFMELLVRTIEGILDNEPVDIYANPTYLPDILIKEYDTLWTPERTRRVIDAAARNGVAIEISNRLNLPKADFIRQAKKAGIKFTAGTNNVDSKLGREEYALQMIRECDLKAGDMFLPKPDGKKPIQVRGFKLKKEETGR